MDRIIETIMQLLEASTATLALLFGLGVLGFTAYCLRLMDKRGGHDAEKK